MKVLTSIFFVAILMACAAPVPINSGQSDFVSRQELQVVSLAQEGMALFNASRFFEAEARFRKALFLDPSLENIKFNLSIVLEKAGFYPEAKQILLELISAHSDNANYLAALARVFKAEGETTLARNYLHRAREQFEDEQNLPASYNIAKALFDFELSLGNTDVAICEAESVLNDSALRQAVDSKELFNNLVLLFISTGNCGRAAAYFENNSPFYMSDESVESLFLRSQLTFCANDLIQTVDLAERASLLPGLDPVKSFELSTLNICSRFLLNEDGLLERESEQGRIEAIKQALKSGALSTLYWSPALIACAHSLNEEIEAQNSD
jgi:tetratricopeptide (TPR) repeat protein